MRAILMRETGGPDVLQPDEVADPQYGPGQVLIRVVAAGVNFADVMTRQGVYLTRDARPTLPAVLGTEVAGVVLAVGDGVDRELVGRRVVAFARAGYAELAVAPAELVAPVPANLDLGAATAFLVQGVSAWQVLVEAGRLRPGDSVLVHAAAGGVGSLAVQLARALGAGQIIATAGSADKRRLAVDLGADVALDYGDPSWPAEVRRLTSGRGADIVLDAVGGDVGELSLSCLAPFGRLVVFGVASKQLSAFAGSQLMQHNQSVMGYWLTSRLAADGSTAQIVGDLMQRAADGALRAIVEHVYALDDAANAHRALSSRETRGKVVLTT